MSPCGTVYTKDRNDIGLRFFCSFVLKKFPWYCTIVDKREKNRHIKKTKLNKIHATETDRKEEINRATQKDIC